MIRQIVHVTKSRLPSMLAGAFLLPILALAAQYGAYHVIPATYWLSYSAITPTEQPVVGEKISLVSTRRAVAGTSVDWLDILRCDAEGGAEFHRSEQRTGDTFISGTGGEYLDGRAWTFPAPPLKGTCTIETNYTVHLPLGVDRGAQFESERFFVQR